MGQMPFGGTGIRHRLDRLVLRCERSCQLFGNCANRQEVLGARGPRRRHRTPYQGGHDSSAPVATAGDNSRLQWPGRPLSLHSLPLPAHEAQVPICESDPWRTQYFDAVACPADVFIPTEDSDAWTWNPLHRWIYDKLAVALSQGLQAAPHGVAPQSFPVFSKPIYNLKGMGVGSRVLSSADDYIEAYQLGLSGRPLPPAAHAGGEVAVSAGWPGGGGQARAIPAAEGPLVIGKSTPRRCRRSKDGAATGVAST